MHLFTTHLQGATHGGTGQVVAGRPDAGVVFPQFQVLPQPAGFNITKTRPSYSQYQSRGYYVGLGSDNAMVDEHRRFSRQGIQAPTVVPTLTAAAGPGTTGAAVTRIAWYDELTDEWGVQSAASDTVNLTNQKRTTGNIPTTAPEPRITHVGVWVEMDGAASRLSTLRQVGVSTITEGVATLALGIAYPVPFSRMPRCAYNTMYHDRQVGAGDARNPDLVYVSQIGYPERWGGLAFRTRNGEPIVALVANRDVCLVLTPFSSYLLRGFTDDDMSLTLVDSDIGALNHWVWAVIHDVIWGANDKGIFIWNQGWHQVNLDLENQWTALYKAYPEQFEDAFCLVDPNYQTYSIYMGTGGDLAPLINSAEIPDPNNVTPQSLAWVAKYSSVTPQIGGSLSQPQWSFDVMDRTIDSAGLLGTPGSRRRDPFIGRCDGIVMTPANLEDDAYATDDDDLYDKMFWVRTKAYDMGDPMGDEKEGKEFVKLYSFLESENDQWTLYVKSGLERSYLRPLPDNTNQGGWWRDDKDAGAMALFTTEFIDEGLLSRVYFEPGSVWSHVPAKCTGLYLTLEYQIGNPKEVFWRGFGGLWIPGDSHRGAVYVVAEEA